MNFVILQYIETNNTILGFSHRWHSTINHTQQGGEHTQAGLRFPGRLEQMEEMFSCEHLISCNYQVRILGGSVTEQYLKTYFMRASCKHMDSSAFRITSKTEMTEDGDYRYRSIRVDILCINIIINIYNNILSPKQAWWNIASVLGRTT